MSRSTTPLTVALWSAVLGCCVWGVNVSQGAAHIVGAQEVIGAQESRETGRQQDVARALASLAYWSDLLQTRSTELVKLPLYSTVDTLISQASASDSEVSIEWISSSAESHHTFAAMRNRWSLGFH
ncbi:MAG: hypothetical protein AAF571_06375 [Verrucomicrobiota bacterium]